MKKKLLFITGTRADFGKIKGLIKEVHASKNLDYQIFATGMHLLERYGSTINEIRKSGLKQIFPFINQDEQMGAQMDYVLANTIQGLGLYIREFTANLIVVHGDRIEALAGAIVGNLNNIPVVHIEGGEISGAIDESIRHAITKLSHIHFVANKDALKRLIQLGEKPEKIYVIGSPDIDIMLSSKLPSIASVRRKYDIRFQEYAIFIYNPVTTELANLRKNIAEVIDAIITVKMNFVVFYPNNDKGSETIFEAIAKLKDLPRFKLIRSMRFEYFLSLLKNSVATVGNSSAGIRENPVYGIPTINIGTRQNKRFSYSSIINVPESKKEILKALKNLPSTPKPSLHFGKGNSIKLFAKTIKKKSFWELTCQKVFIDMDINDSEKMTGSQMSSSRRKGKIKR